MWEAHVGKQEASPEHMIAVLKKMSLTQDIIDEIRRKCTDC